MMNLSQLTFATCLHGLSREDKIIVIISSLKNIVRCHNLLISCKECSHHTLCSGVIEITDTNHVDRGIKVLDNLAIEDAILGTSLFKQKIEELLYFIESDIARSKLPSAKYGFIEEKKEECIYAR